MKETIKLTQYSHGAGCGCKISPAVLDTILAQETKSINPALLVGNYEKDDAAVYDLGDERALISTTDFFMPIVDDAFDFGRIAAANAISDVYAMGGSPVLALAILGWPLDKLPPETAKQVLDGARAVCEEAGISLAGGHSIDSPEPIFGLAVNGIIAKENIKTNAKAAVGSKLYLTKPIGIGVLSTAQKRGLLLPSDAEIMVKSMTTLNKIGFEFGQMSTVTALTDVTGFGLLGHLLEMCEASGVAAEIEFDAVPVFSSLHDYIKKDCIPGGTNRNWKSYGAKVGSLTEVQRLVLADPQTSGGLMAAVKGEDAADFEKEMHRKNQMVYPIGRITEAESDILIRLV